MPVNWVDGVTPVNAANLEILDADIAARQVLTEKGAANGYAPLDSTSKVPLANLPPVSGVDFIGTWAAGTAYKRGDVIRYQGNDYMAVNDSTGVTPPAPGSPIIVGASYGTSLPTAPFDGQEAILVDSVTAPTYQWRFRYNAGNTTAYKWEFVGGAPWVVSGSDLTLGAGVFTNIPGATVTVPRAGDYYFTTTCRFVLPAAAGDVILAGDAGVSMFSRLSLPANASGFGAVNYRKLGLPSLTVWNSQAYSTVASTQVTGCVMSVVPLRVS